MLNLLLLGFLLISSSYASVCERTNQDIVDALKHSDSRIAFKNNGGLFNGGVCWWHSRLQRSSAVLAYYSPEKNKPSAYQVSIILGRLRNMNSIVEIPGFENFEAFTAYFQTDVQAELEKWQKIDGFLNHQWIRGLSGNYQLPSQTLQNHMDKLYQAFKVSPHPIWIMAQMKGIESHSFLVMDMSENGHGYDLSVIDSNKPKSIRKINYQVGDKSVSLTDGKKEFIPYLGFQGDWLKLNETLSQFCGRQSFNSAFPMGDLEL
jgi:hypothetical protein